MNLTTLLGLAAGTLTTIAFIPQLIKTWKSKSAKDLSLEMLLIFSTGVLLWLIYGILRQDWPVIIANSVTLVLTTINLVLKLRHD